jgi:serine/threonine-protein kinase
MADIYRATDTSLDREVAVKVLAEHLTEDGDLRARFVREALAAASLCGQPHIVGVYDVGEADGRPFFVMEHLDGGSLANRLTAGAVGRPQALRWLEQIARALDAAHERGVVHRDVKPANILLDRDGNIRVADFGIARIAGGDSHTQTGVVLGTAGYLAPEQLAGTPVTAAADRYSLAVVAHELLTGTRPGTDTPPPPARTVFDRALSARPEDRYPSSLAFVHELEAALDGSELPTRVLAARRRRRAPLAIAGALALAVAAGLAILGLSSNGGSKRPGVPAPVPVVRTVTVQAPAVARPVAQATPANVKGQKAGKHHGHGKKKSDEQD